MTDSSKASLLYKHWRTNLPHYLWDDGPPLGPCDIKGTPRGGCLLGMTQKTCGSTRNSTGKFCFWLLFSIHGNGLEHLQRSGLLLGHQTMTFPPTAVACEIPKGSRQVGPLLAAEKWKGYSHREGSHMQRVLIFFTNSSRSGGWSRKAFPTVFFRKTEILKIWSLAEYLKKLYVADNIFTVYDHVI